MFSINFGDFLNNIFSFDFNTANQIFLFFHNFDFQGPSGRQMDLIFLPRHFFGK
jgi:hypothetical protein